MENHYKSSLINIEKGPKQFRPAFGCMQHLQADQNAQHLHVVLNNRVINSVKVLELI